MEYVWLWLGIGGVVVVNAIVMAFIVTRTQEAHRKRGMTQHYHLDVESTDLLPDEEMDAIREQAREKMLRGFGDTFAHFDQALEKMSGEIMTVAEKQFNTKLSSELGKFESTMAQATIDVQAVVDGVTKEFKAESQTMRANLEVALANEKASRLADFEERMATVVASYIADSFDGNEKMIEQTDTIVAWLDKHKNEIKKDLA